MFSYTSSFYETNKHLLTVGILRLLDLFVLVLLQIVALVVIQEHSDFLV